MTRPHRSDCYRIGKLQPSIRPKLHLWYTADIYYQFARCWFSTANERRKRTVILDEYRVPPQRWAGSYPVHFVYLILASHQFQWRRSANWNGVRSNGLSCNFISRITVIEYSWENFHSQQFQGMKMGQVYSGCWINIRSPKAHKPIHLKFSRHGSHPTI